MNFPEKNRSSRQNPSSSLSSSPSRSSSSSTSTCSSLSVSSPWLLSSGLPTTVYVQMPEDRPYSGLLRQTEIVYDQLLSERQRKLQQKISERQSQYLEKYGQLLQTDQTKASEFERWATAALSHLKNECSKELNELRQDYESKFVKMRISLEEQWTADNCSPNTFNVHHPQQQQHPMHLANRQ